MNFLTRCYLIRSPQVPWVISLETPVTICHNTPAKYNVCVKAYPASNFSDICPTQSNYSFVTNTYGIVNPIVEFNKAKIVSEYIVQFIVLYRILCCFV